MTATTTALVPLQPAFSDAERLVLAGFLAGYRGLTREAYALDLRQFTSWCRARSLNVFAVRRADIESFARDLEARGRARATVTRRLCTIAGFYKYAVEEELLEHSPAARVRWPRSFTVQAGQTPGEQNTDKKASQAITFGQPPAATVGQVVPLTASATSGLAVSFRSDTPSVCTSPAPPSSPRGPASAPSPRPRLVTTGTWPLLG